MPPLAGPLRVTIWNEFRHERESAIVGKIYPNGIHAAIAEGLREHLGSEAVIETATLDQPEHGLSEEALAASNPDELRDLRRVCSQCNTKARCARDLRHKRMAAPSKYCPNE